MKKLIILVLVFIIAFTITSCETSAPPILVEATPTATASPTSVATPTATIEITPTPTVAATDTPIPTATPEPTRTPLEPIRTLASGTEIYAFGGGSTSFEFDLDGDGILDTISFEFRGVSCTVPEGALTLDSTTEDMHSYDINQCNLRINDQPIIVQGELMAGLVLVVDINNSDGKYELIVPEFGPSHDPLTTFITYNGVAPQQIGQLYDNPFIKLRIDGNSQITGMKRGRKLHTWFYDATYIMQSGLLVEYRESGYVHMSSSVTAKVPLPLQVSPTDTTLAYTLSSGDEIVITLTDNDRWFCVQNGSGQTGWFEVEGFYTINGQPATDVFDGLFMAD